MYIITFKGRGVESLMLSLAFTKALEATSYAHNMTLKGGGKFLTSECC